LYECSNFYFKNNIATYGGGMYVDYMTIGDGSIQELKNFTNFTFENNRASKIKK
jgi:hypothetical protein